MAENRAAWGIEIGNAGLKALRLEYVASADQVVATAFDYVPHPKLLSQPDAVPDELVREALQTFLSRNTFGGDLVAVSLPGQTALAKFIQLPPVETSRVAAIIRYEAQQQIPFALEEVIWDWQILGSGMQEGGYLLDAEVGLFAMKREQVQHHLRPYLERKVEIELVQIAPLALYNFLCFDRLGIRPDQEDRPEYDEYFILLDMGCDNTTLLVTNGKKIWIRNVPLGGNHFTRALTKEMKLTFAKAEHLKCNATKAPDPKAVFQALRPVFNDYVAEINRSIGYFTSVNRSARISRLIGVGNGFKLAGLQKFLQQNLQYEVDRIDHFDKLIGEKVLAAPLFLDNLLTFTVPYGLALQALRLTDIHTSLLPREIAVARLIRRKKPWAVATAASLLLGLSMSTVGYGLVSQSVSVARWGNVESEADKLSSEVNSLKNKYNSEKSRNQASIDQGESLFAMLPQRELWMEVYKAIDECLPRDEGQQLDETDIAKMNRISLDSITCKRYTNLEQWYNGLNENTRQTYLKDPDKGVAPNGDGYVFTLVGHHYHHEDNNPTTGQGFQYVEATLIKNLYQDAVVRNGVRVADVRRMGISHALVVKHPPSREVPFYPHGKPGAPHPGGMRPGVSGAPGASPFSGGTPGFGPMGPGGYGPGATPYGSGYPGAVPMTPGRRPLGATGGVANRVLSGQLPNLEDTSSSVQPIKLKRTDFVVQFVWKPILPEQRPEWNPAAANDASGTQADASSASPTSMQPSPTPTNP
ncbi:MAG: hypothetical protein KatS3mg114_0623 [Planctomycetaceae bacterium]|nr:MAG: hypothetical protein KatS3mg114_0623 [Planctomycetaceae bacterium]